MKAAYREGNAHLHPILRYDSNQEDAVLVSTSIGLETGVNGRSTTNFGPSNGSRDNSSTAGDAAIYGHPNPCGHRDAPTVHPRHSELRPPPQQQRGRRA